MKTNFLASYNDAVSMLKDGQAQAFTLGTTIPSGAVMDLATSRRIRVLDLEDSVEPMKKINSGYVGVTMPANTYPNQPAALTKIGYAAHLVVSCKLPEDRVYTMLKTVAREHQGPVGRQQGDGEHDAQGDGRGHRRSVPSGCQALLQRGRREDVTLRRAACGPPSGLPGPGNSGNDGYDRLPGARWRTSSAPSVRRCRSGTCG
jgi:hypothetical protein